MTQIAVVNKSLSATNVAEVVAAIQKQVTRDLAPAHGVSATIFDSTHHTVPPGAWPCYLLDHSDVDGALGYHDLVKGTPVLKVFVADDIADGLSWSVTLSHEVIEALGDPGCQLASDLGNGRFVGFEHGDPVEDDRYGYLIDGVMVSDFVLPSWYQAGSKGPWDFARHLKAPLSLLPGGYASVYQAGKWGQVTARGDGKSRADTSTRIRARAGRRVVSEIT